MGRHETSHLSFLPVLIKFDAEKVSAPSGRFQITSAFNSRGACKGESRCVHRQRGAFYHHRNCKQVHFKWASSQLIRTGIYLVFAPSASAVLFTKFLTNNSRNSFLLAFLIDEETKAQNIVVASL